MKKFYSILLIVSGFAFGQIETPQPSPLAKIEQVVGLTDVAITYSRPAMRNRSIMGDLVPYGEMWRAGANANTTIEFSDDVIIGGQALSSGKYAIFIRLYNFLSCFNRCLTKKERLVIPYGRQDVSWSLETIISRSLGTPKASLSRVPEL